MNDKIIGKKYRIGHFNRGECFVRDNKRGMIVQVIPGDRTAGSVKARFEAGTFENWEDDDHEEVVFIGEGVLHTFDTMEITWPDSVVSKWRSDGK